jgi:alanine racemase
MIQFSQLDHILNGKTIANRHDQPVTDLLIDSRKATGRKGTLFFAIHGTRHDGHKYIQELYNQGIRMFVVEQVPPYSERLLPEASIYQVESAITALQDLVAYHRASFTLPVIGITGSNGKTIIKEWLYQMLAKDMAIAKNPGSYNSQVGVPLSVWQLQAHHQLGIFEAGISQPGEMQHLQRVIQPTLGIFTNIGSAHDEGFASLEQKIREKLRLFTSVETLVYCRDAAPIHNAVVQAAIPAFSWGYSPEADVYITADAQGTFTVRHTGHAHTLSIPFADKASQENCFLCITLLLKMGYTMPDIQSRISNLRAIPMRLELKEGINQSQVIDDTYNNDLAGLEISIQFLQHQHQKKKKRLILSDILQSGLPDDELVRSIAALVNKSTIDSFVGIGPILSNHRQAFAATAQFFSSTDEFLRHFDTDIIQQEIILVKGARAFQFEQIVQKLQRKVHGTVMEINLDALVHNLNYFRARLEPGTKIMVMVKAFAYGSGSNEIANILQYHKVDYLGVAYADEGVDLRKNNITLPIMVMNPSEDSFGSLLQYNLEPEVYNIKILKALIAYLQNKPCGIHIKLDTGMHRLGFEEHELPELIALLQANTNLRVNTIFSHLAGADESRHDAFSRQQAALFKTMAGTIAQAIGYKPLYHILNSPGILRLTDLQLDMVRLGIGLYGVDPTSENFRQLEPVATLKTIISQIKTIPRGQTIGYGRRGVAEHDMRLATIAIGYADGFSRAFSRGVGEVLVHGRRARVTGNVCMDMTMIDITGIPAHEGDEVIIFGPQMPIHNVAAAINTIPYEILTNTSERVKRIFITQSL